MHNGWPVVDPQRTGGWSQSPLLSDLLISLATCQMTPTLHSRWPGQSISAYRWHGDLLIAPRVPKSKLVWLLSCQEHQAFPSPTPALNPAPEHSSENSDSLETGQQFALLKISRLDPDLTFMRKQKVLSTISDFLVPIPIKKKKKPPLIYGNFENFF